MARVATFVITDFVRDFCGFVDLSLVVCSITIKSIKNRWITCDFDEW